MPSSAARRDVGSNLEEDDDAQIRFAEQRGAPSSVSLILKLFCAPAVFKHDASEKRHQEVEGYSINARMHRGIMSAGRASSLLCNQIILLLSEIGTFELDYSG